MIQFDYTTIDFLILYAIGIVFTFLLGLTARSFEKQDSTNKNLTRRDLRDITLFSFISWFSLLVVAGILVQMAFEYLDDVCHKDSGNNNARNL